MAFHVKLITVRKRLNVVFGTRTKSLHGNIESSSHSGNIESSSHSLDLTPYDSFFWGWLKSKVFATPPQSLNSSTKNC